MSLTTAAARRDLAFHLHPSTNLRQLQREGPLVITRGEGVYVYDDEGERYLEGMAGLWCASLGVSEERLALAAHRQMLGCRSITASPARSLLFPRSLRRNSSAWRHAA